MAITKLILNGTEYEIGNLVYTTGPQLYDGIELEDYTWADFQEMCNNGDFENLREGDYKTIELTTGEIVQPQIAGLDTYYRTHNLDTSVNTTAQLGHTIDWVSKDCLATTVQWNTSNFNNGNADYAQPYLASYIYSYLMGTLYPTVPSDIKAVITNKTALLENRYSTASTLTDSTNWYWFDIGPIWLLHEYEVYGSTVWGTKGFSSGQIVQYPLYANGWQHRTHGLGYQGSSCGWWLVETRSGNSTSCCFVSGYGQAGSDNASAARGVPVAFEITGV